MASESLDTLIAGAAAGGAALSAVAGLGFWLRDQFSKRDNALYQRMDADRQDAQVRHEDNLEKFKNIEVALAVLGWRNGKGGHRAP